MGREIYFYLVCVYVRCATKHKRYVKEEIWGGTTTSTTRNSKTANSQRARSCKESWQTEIGIEGSANRFSLKPAAQNKAATEASFRVSHHTAQHKKAFTDGNSFKEAMAITTETVFNDFKNKDDIKTALRGVPLGPATVTSRVESLSGNMDRQVLKDLSLFEYVSLQFDEPLDVMDTALLVVFVRMDFQDSTAKDDFFFFALKGENKRGRYLH